MSTLALRSMLNTRFARLAFKYGKDPLNTIQRAYQRNGKTLGMALRGIDRLRAITASRRVPARRSRVARSRNSRKRGRTADTRTGRSAPRSIGRGFFMTAQSPETVNVNRLYFRTITFPQLVPNSDSGRRGNNLMFTGFKACVTFYNDAPYPVELHFCIVRWVNKEFINPGLGLTEAELGTDMFRDPTNLSDREADFPTVTTSYQRMLKCYNLNTQKFNIMTHRRILMGAKTTSTSVNDARHIQKIDKFYRVGKRIIFENNTDSVPNNPFVMFVYWTPVDQADFLAPAAACRWETIITPYYGP